MSPKTLKPREDTVRLSTKGVVLREIQDLPETRLQDLVGCTGYRGPAKSLEDMEAGIAQGVRRQRDRAPFAQNGQPDDVALDITRPESQSPLGRLFGILAHLAGDRPVTIEEMNEGIKQWAQAKFDGATRTPRPFPGKEAVRKEVGQWLGKRANRFKG